MRHDDPHILVVDDDQRLRNLLRKYLAEQGFLVTTADSSASARAQLQGLKFDLIVLDIMMPGESGLDFTRTMRLNLDTPILLLTAMGSSDARIAGLESGADDYLAKPFEPRELVLRINNILRRIPPQAETPLEIRFGAFAFDTARGELTRDGDRIHLTSAEEALMRVFCSQPGETLSREDLQATAGLGGNARTIDVQVTRLRRKIETDPRLPRYLVTVRGEGYVLRPDRA